MSRKIYKYFSPQVAALALLQDKATLKCSLPSNFNDPYELFLTVDYSSRPDALASYQELIGTLPQLPTTCFSKSPAVVPMWAHYGANASGFALEFDEAELLKAFPGSKLEDVVYQDEASPDLTEMLYRAHVIGKPRYTYFLQGGVFHAAYFTKATCWSYEAERRMVAAENEVREAHGMLFMDVPVNCITSVIAGAKASAGLILMLSESADHYGCGLYRTQIGRTSISPYFLDNAGIPHVFNGSGIAAAAASCRSCKEPLEPSNEACSWCQITDDQRYSAAVRNPYRILDSVGHLDSYLASMNKITEGITRSRKGS
ncbi:DUF2971 domain-containing protein [Xanthomonas arboricola]|uniref:DUF2971 domain-containing protein n=1 Tax=Xanthomonas arboricola TaxID=56448 RepID=UPI00141B4CA2|nr:DUF2971 domain-containing protein [Xanthomonas arboricola]